MTLLAHTGHWLVSLAYLLPLVVLAVVILAGRLSDRRSERGGQPGVQASIGNATVEASGAKKEV